MSTTVYERYSTAITSLETALNSLYSEFIASTSSVGGKSYTFNSGSGSQSTSYRSPKEVLEIIQQTESHLNWLYRKCGQGGGLVNLNLRRQFNEIRSLNNE